MPRPYPREFREDVVRVARNRGPDVRVKDIATDFGADGNDHFDLGLDSSDEQSLAGGLAVPCLLCAHSLWRRRLMTGLVR
jgi:hypothetical protein